MLFLQLTRTRLFVLGVLVITSTSAQGKALYTVKAGDCLSGIVAAYYPKATGHVFVLRANPVITLDELIVAGQTLVLPGLTTAEISGKPRYTGCGKRRRAAVKTGHRLPVQPGPASSTILPHAAGFSIKHNFHRPLVLATPPTHFSVVQQEEGGLLSPTDSALDTEGWLEVKPRPYRLVYTEIPAAKRLSRVIPVTPRLVGNDSGTPPSLVKPASDRDGVAVDPALLRATRASGVRTHQMTLMPKEPVFASDQLSDAVLSADNAASLRSYVVNVIGARTASADTALVQHADQSFHVEKKGVWGQRGRDTHVLQQGQLVTARVPPENTQSTALAPPSSATPPITSTDAAGRLFIDPDLLTHSILTKGVAPQ